MRSLFFAVLRTSLVIGVGMVASAAVALWAFTGTAPTSLKEFRTAAKDLANFHQIKKEMVARSYHEAELIKDDFDQPAGVNSDTIAAKEAEEANLAKINAEIAEATKGAALEREQLAKKEIAIMKHKLAQLQTQLDRIENQNRALTLKISGLVKNSKIQNQ